MEQHNQITQIRNDLLLLLLLFVHLSLRRWRKMRHRTKGAGIRFFFFFFFSFLNLLLMKGRWDFGRTSDEERTRAFTASPPVRRGLVLENKEVGSAALDERTVLCGRRREGRGRKATTIESRDYEEGRNDNHLNTPRLCVCGYV